MTLLDTGRSVFGVETVKEAPSKVILKHEQFEVRLYAPLLVAQTRVIASYKEADIKAFRTLYRYISGENEVSRKIAMTAPVIAEPRIELSQTISDPLASLRDGNDWLFRFVLPEEYTVDSAPQPINPDVVIARTTKMHLATIRYSGRATESARIENAEALLSWIVSKGLVAKSAPKWAGYNAPWTLPNFRRNEVMIEVAKR